MNLSLRSIVAVLAATSILPLTACGGGGGGTGGDGAGGGTTTTTTNSGTTNSGTTNSGTTSTGGNTCADYCDAQLACINPAECVLVDSAAAKTTCESACEAGLGTLTAMETSVLQACLDCIFSKGTPGTCFDDLPFAACNAECNTPAVESAGEKWTDASKPPANATGGLCTNGMDILKGQECTGSSDGTTCTTECCNGACGATPDVGVSCTPESGTATCTCTAGKNMGKTFQSTNACGDDVWTQCNL